MKSRMLKIQPRLTEKKVHKKIVKDLEYDLYCKFYNLNLRSSGAMRTALRKLYHRQASYFSGGKVFYVIDPYDRVITWALVVYCQRVYGSSLIPDLIGIYTRKQFRRQGFGTLVFQEILKTNSQLHLHPHNNESEAFFASQFLD